MPTESFIDLARKNDSFESDQGVRDVARAVLRTLGEAISRGQAIDLAEHLPADLSDAVLDGSHEEEHPEAPAVGEFYNRVANRAGVPRSHIQPKVQGVMVALSGTVGDAEFDDTRAQLPPEYDSVFEPARALRGLPFAHAVQKRTDLDSPAEARRVSSVVLQALGERLSRGEAEDLAVYLPAELSDDIIQDRLETDYDVDEFVDRIVELGGYDETDAREYAAAVTTVLAAVARGEEVERAAEQLPEGFDRLLAHSR